MKVRSETRHYLVHDNKDYALEHEPIYYIDPLIREDENGVTIAYLVQDPFCEDPLAEMGSEIHERNSREAWRALGLDEYGGPDIDEDEMEYEWKNFLEAIPNHEERERLSMLGWDRCEEGGWDYDAMAEKCTTPPNRFARLLDKFEHSGVEFSLHGEGTQCRWDTSRGSHVFVPGADLERHLLGLLFEQPKRKEDEIVDEYIRNLLDQYNEYLAGNCYGLVVQKYDEDCCCIDSDELWGIVGYEDAEKMLQGAIKEKEPCPS